MIKSSGVAFDKINAKIADSSKIRPVDVTGEYMISKPPFNPKPSLHSKCFRRNSLVAETHLNVLQKLFVDMLISQRVFLYKGWSKVMYGVSILNFASLVPECTVTRNILQWDLIH